MSSLSPATRPTAGLLLVSVPFLVPPSKWISSTPIRGNHVRGSVNPPIRDWQRRRAKLGQGALFDLAHTLTRHPQPPADLTKRNSSPSKPNRHPNTSPSRSVNVETNPRKLSPVTRSNASSYACSTRVRHQVTQAIDLALIAGIRSIKRKRRSLRQDTSVTAQKSNPSARSNSSGDASRPLPASTRFGPHASGGCPKAHGAVTAPTVTAQRSPVASIGAPTKPHTHKTAHPARDQTGCNARNTPSTPPPPDPPTPNHAPHSHEPPASPSVATPAPTAHARPHHHWPRA